MRIGFLMGPNAPADDSLIPQVAALLTAWGAVVEPIRISDRLIDVFGVRAEHDLYVLKDPDSHVDPECEAPCSRTPVVSGSATIKPVVAMASA